MYEMDHNLIELMVASLTIVISVLIALWNRKRKNDSIENYTFGSRNMSTFAIFCSHYAANTSAIMMLGVPAEAYSYGTTYALCFVMLIALGFTQAYLVLPVLYKFKFRSIYEYLELRFNGAVRTALSTLSTVWEIVYSAVITYSASIVFQRLFGITLPLISATLLGITTFYVAMGGYKGLIYTDNAQIGIFALSTIPIFTLAAFRASEQSNNILSDILESDRFQVPNFSFDPKLRYTFWSSTIGAYFAYAYQFMGPAAYQRAISLPTLRQAQIAAISHGVCQSMTLIIFTTIGLMLLVVYKGCDPVLSKGIKKYDQIIPYFIISNKHVFPGFVGLFSAGVLGATLSSLATCLNNSVVVIYKDFVLKGLLPLNIRSSESVSARIIQTLYVLVALIIWLLSYSMVGSRTIINMKLGFSGLTSSAIFAVFILGLLFPRVSSKGILCATVPWLFITVWIVVTSESSSLKYPTNAMSVDNCSISTLEPITYSTGLEVNETMHFIHKISVNNYSIVGFLFVMIISISVSYLLPGGSTYVPEKDLISPLVHKYLGSNRSGANEGQSTLIRGTSFFP